MWYNQIPLRPCPPWRNDVDGTVIVSVVERNLSIGLNHNVIVIDDDDDSDDNAMCLRCAKWGMLRGKLATLPHGV